MTAQQTEVEPRATAAIKTWGRPRGLDLDLIALAVTGALVPLVPLIPLAVVRVPLGLVLALGLPGYALTTTLFPDHRDLDHVTRTVLSFGISVALYPLLALALSALPWGIHPLPITISLALWTLAMAGIAVWRRRAIDQPTDAAADEPQRRSPLLPKLREQSRGRYVLFGGTMLGVVTIGLLSGQFIHPPSHATEFYVLGSAGMAEQYPSQVTTADQIALTVGVVSDEPAERTFSVEVRAVDAEGSGREARLTTAGPMSLEPGRAVEFAVSFRMPWVGADQRIDIFLYRDGDDEPYRQLRLWIDVVDEPT